MKLLRWWMRAGHVWLNSVWDCSCAPDPDLEGIWVAPQFQLLPHHTELCQCSRGPDSLSSSTSFILHTMSFGEGSGWAVRRLFPMQPCKREGRRAPQHMSFLCWNRWFGLIMLRTINTVRSSISTGECCSCTQWNWVFLHKPVPELSSFLSARATGF